MNQLIRSFLLTAVFTSYCANINAQEFDTSQKIEIDATRQAADLKNKVFSYIDNVVITQGTLIIRADLVQVMTKAGTEEKTYIAKGKPATFEQILTDGTPLNLEAEEIRYEPEMNIVTISGNALLKQEDSEVTGSKITYNFVTQYVNAESKADEQVKTIFQPKAKSEEESTTEGDQK